MMKLAKWTIVLTCTVFQDLKSFPLQTDDPLYYTPSLSYETGLQSDTPGNLFRNNYSTLILEGNVDETLLEVYGQYLTRKDLQQLHLSGYDPSDQAQGWLGADLVNTWVMFAVKQSNESAGSSTVFQPLDFSFINTLLKAELHCLSICMHSLAYLVAGIFLQPSVT